LQKDLKQIRNLNIFHKGEACPVYALKTYSCNSGVAALILMLGTEWKWLVSVTPWPV